jgi:hypothetical protein
MATHRIASLDFSRINANTPEQLSPIAVRRECELQRAVERRRAVSSTFHQMSEFLHRFLHGDTSKKALLNLAAQLAQTKGVKVDRTAKRTKEGLICWFCEFAAEMNSTFNQLSLDFINQELGGEEDIF